MKHVLLVEDDPIIARLTRALMTRFGWQMDWVSSGREAIELLAERRYPLVLLDLGLPDVGGAGVAIWLRHFEMDRGHARTRVVIVTADHGEQARGIDVDGVLQKPLRMHVVESLLRSIETPS